LKPKVFIDGREGTTGLRIHERLAARDDIELLAIAEDKRKDIKERSKLINAADLVFLCLPDEAAREAVSLIDNSTTRVIDASTAHRLSTEWVYGLPELSRRHKERISKARFVANPGCHATGFILSVRPLVSHHIMPKDCPLPCFSLTGYSGGGKAMIADYESLPDGETRAPGLYALNLLHKHLPEMMAAAGLMRAPVFSPIVGDFHSGMATSVAICNATLRSLTPSGGDYDERYSAGDLLLGYGPPKGFLSPGRKTALGKPPTAEDIRKLLAKCYSGQPFVTVAPTLGGGTLYSDWGVGTNDLEITVSGNDESTLITARFDNLGKGASGAAVQNMNIMLGFEETKGLLCLGS
jgi:N-acetyl-gamma-glutamyl-phosphate reductase